MSAIAEDKVIGDMYQQNPNITRIASFFKVNPYRVYSALARLGLRPMPKAWAEKRSPSALLDPNKLRSDNGKKRGTYTPTRKKRRTKVEMEQATLDKKVDAALEAPLLPDVKDLPVELKKDGGLYGTRTVEVLIAMRVGQNRERSRDCVFCRERKDDFFKSRGETCVCTACIKAMASQVI